MRFVKIEDKDKLNNFLKKQKYSQFLESWEWIELQNNSIFYFGLELENELIATISLIKKKLFFGKYYFYAPRGPVFNLNLSFDFEKALNFLFSEIKKIAQEENVSFLRFEPLFQFKNFNLKHKIKRSIDIQPKKTLLLNLEKNENDLLSAMHQKTRYNIKLASKKGIIVKEIKDISKYFNDFWNIMEETSKRDSFYLHSRDHYYQILKLDFLKLLGAFYNDELIAVNIVSFFGDLATYVHGASGNKNRNLMAPYALQWESIKMAKKYNCKYYDFYGIDEKKWPGVTRFKKGFSGEEKEYPGTFDLIFNSSFYYFYYFLRVLKRRAK